MSRVPRAQRVGQPAAASSKLRLVLLLTVIAASAMLLAGTSVGAALTAALFGARTGIPGGAVAALTILALLGGGAFVMFRRRQRSGAVPVRRAFRSQAAPIQRDGNPLRQLRGRGALEAGLQEKLNAHAEEGRQLAVHRLDIDRFHQVNHCFGAGAGDELLLEVGRRLAQLAGGGENLARLGDDEFAVIQPETGGAKHAEIFAARIQKALEEPIAVGPAEILVTASIGIAVAPEHGADAPRLLTSADLALQWAKQAGRGAIRPFERGMAERLELRRSLEQAVRQGLQGDGPILRYQPEYDLVTRRLLGFEVQVVLEDQRLGTLGEDEFGPVAADTGLLQAIGARAIREACRTACKWPQHLRLGFKVLPGHLSGGDFAKILADALKTHHLSPSRVDLEVAGPLLSAGGQQARDQLQRLSEMGFRLVLDGYGSGHCGPLDLWRSRVSAIKIDAGLVRQIGAGEGTEPLVGAIIKFGQALGLQIIANGADRVEQVHYLMLNGCRNVVGPVFGPAVAADKVTALIEKDMRNAASQEETRRPSSAAA